MRIRLRRALPLALTFTLSSCFRINPFPGAPGPEGPSMSIPRRGTTPTRGLARKRVTAKQEPNLLVAEDGTSCVVTAERYEDVDVGDHELCDWQ
jgi:hypothetical protein